MMMGYDTDVPWAALVGFGLVGKGGRIRYFDGVVDKAASRIWAYILRKRTGTGGY